MPDPTGPVTLGDLIRDDKLLGVYCCDCCHERDVNPAPVPLPPETPVPEIGKKMKCSKCGSRKVDTRPELYPGSIEKMRERWGGGRDDPADFRRGERAGKQNGRR